MIVISLMINGAVGGHRRWDALIFTVRTLFAIGVTRIRQSLQVIDGSFSFGGYRHGCKLPMITAFIGHIVMNNPSCVSFNSRLDVVTHHDALTP